MSDFNKTPLFKWVWEVCPAKNGDKLLMLCFACFCKSPRGDTWVAPEMIEAKTGMTRRNIYRCIRRAVEAGWLVMTNDVRSEGGRRQCRRYLIPYLGDNLSEEGQFVQSVTICQNTDNLSEFDDNLSEFSDNLSTDKEDKEDKEINTAAQETSSPSQPPQSGDGLLKPRKRATAFNALSIPLPHRSGFATAWSEFVQHRREIKAPLTPTATKRILASLGAVNEATACEALGKSVRHGWRGVFPESAAPQQPPAAAVASPKWVDLSMYTQPRKEVA